MSTGGLRFFRSDLEPTTKLNCFIVYISEGTNDFTSPSPTQQSFSVSGRSELERRYPGATFNIEDSNEKVNFTDRIRGTKTALPLKRLIQINCDEAGRVLRPIEDEPYYHGFLERAEVEKIIKKEGEFLVRKTEVGGRHYFVITLKDAGTLKHFLIKRTSTKRLYWVNEYAFKTVNDLIQYHLRNHKPLSASGVYIEKICPKKEWQLNPEQIEPQEKIGEGAFGEVYRGLLQDGIWGARIPVAIKTLHSTNMTADDRIKFLQEANIMREFRHAQAPVIGYKLKWANEKAIFGVELHTGNPSTPYSSVNPMPQIWLNLAGHILQPSLVAKINYVYGGARGMAYLQTKQIIHRDIAARNCLLGENECIKISDFGLSFIGKILKEKKLKKVPLRWMAPETLRTGVYSTKTDVYSFAVLMWEIFSYGQLPFYKYGNRELRKLITQKKVTLDKCLGEITPEMDALRLRCMDFDADRRPDFIEIEAIVSKMPDVIKPARPSLWNRIYTAITDYIYGRVYT